MLTEQEAKEKWCPMAGSTVNIDDRALRNCIASDCMMWRWHDPDQREVFRVHGKRDRTKQQVVYPLTGEDQSGSWVFIKVENRQGYCGLAGHPFPAFVVGS